MTKAIKTLNLNENKINYHLLVRPLIVIVTCHPLMIHRYHNPYSWTFPVIQTKIICRNVSCVILYILKAN